MANLTQKTPLLFLVHRIPYPPNKGDKIRSFHMLKFLAEQYDVHLGTFIDDPFDQQYINDVSAFTKSRCFVTLHPRWAKMKSLTGLLTGEALTVPYYRNRNMQKWIDKTLQQHDINTVLVFSSAMAQYAPPHLQTRTIVDFVDIDSDKWRQYADTQSFPMNWVYTRESQKLFAYERTIAKACKRSLFVSATEAACFQQKNPALSDKIGYFNNGVDLDYFDPTVALDNPFPTTCTPIVFTGAMDYWANIEGVVWFASNVLTTILHKIPDAVFYIVGGNPSQTVQRLSDQHNIEVLGRVPDIRPYLKHARLVVAPLRIARGIQNKVLEAMAMDKTIVVTPQAQAGILPTALLDDHCHAEPAAFAQACVTALQQPHANQGRDFIVDHYHWKQCIDRLIHALNEPPQE